jgi:hypothetical protein
MTFKFSERWERKRRENRLLWVRKQAEALVLQQKNTLFHQMVELVEAKGRQIIAQKVYEQAQREQQVEQVEQVEQAYAQMKQAAAQAEQIQMQVMQTKQACLQAEQACLQAAQVWRQALVGQSSPVGETTIIPWLSRFLDERARAEWVGDLYEMRMIWREQGLSSWMIHTRTVGVALQLLVAQLRCIAYDRVFTRFWEKS